MHTEIITTITTRIDLDSMTPTTSVKVDCEDDLPRPLIYAAVEGACRAAADQAAREGGRMPRVNLSDDEEGEEEEGF